MSETTDDVLRFLISLMGRSVFHEDHLLQIICPPGTSNKQVMAYNLCDGTKTQGEVAKKAKIDPGNFSRTVARWIEAGVVCRIGEGRDAKLLHAYPVPSRLPKTRQVRKKK